MGHGDTFSRTDQGLSSTGAVLVDPTHEDMYWEINGRIVVPRLLIDSEWATMKPKGLSPRGKQPAPKLNPPFARLPSDVQALRDT